MKWSSPGGSISPQFISVTFLLGYLLGAGTSFGRSLMKCLPFPFSCKYGVALASSGTFPADEADVALDDFPFFFIPDVDG